MIYTLTIKSVYGRYLEENCERVLEIEKTASLYELHREIQMMMDFDFDHLYEFYTSRSGHPYRKKGMPGKLDADAFEDDWEAREENWGHIKLEDIWPLEKGKLYYLFDYGDNWVFSIGKKRGEKEAEEGVSYPRVIKSVGPTPQQYPSYDE